MEPSTSSGSVATYEKKSVNDRLTRELRLSLTRILESDMPTRHPEPQEEGLKQRRRCHTCPLKLQRKSTHTCYFCKKHVCLQCEKNVCPDCV